MMPMIAAIVMVIKKVDADTKMPNPAMDTQNSWNSKGPPDNEASNEKFS